MQTNLLSMLIAGIGLVAVTGCKEASLPTARQRCDFAEIKSQLIAVAHRQETADEAAAAGRSCLVRLDAQRKQLASQLEQLPAHEPLTVSEEQFQLLQIAERISQSSGGAFDITCGPLTELWREASQQDRSPSQEEIRQALNAVGWSKLKLDPAARTVTRSSKDLRIDLSGIENGHALDVAAEAMRRQGASGGRLEIGTDIVVFGHPQPNKSWHVDVPHPYRPEPLFVLSVTDAAVSTSQLNPQDGQRRGWPSVIDPRKGQPAAEAVSVTVIAPDGATADAWATTLLVLPINQGHILTEVLDDVEAVWTWGSADDPQTAWTRGFADYVAK